MLDGIRQPAHLRATEEIIHVQILTNRKGRRAVLMTAATKVRAVRILHYAHGA